MNHRNFGRTGIKVSPLALGTMNFGGRQTEEQSLRIVDRALEAGVNFLDTANVYGHDPADFAQGRGRSEEILGKALKGRRDRVFLATKAHFPMGDDPNACGNSRRHILGACHASLKRLQTDHLDLFQLHHPSNEVPIDETLRALDDLVRQGAVRYLGTSSFGAWQIVEGLWASKEYGLNRFVSEQPAYNLLDRRAERELLPMAQTYGIAVIPWSPTAGGFLTGKYRRGAAVPEGSRFDGFWKGASRSHFTDRAFDVLEAVEQLALEKGCTPGQLALAWVMAQPGVTAPIIGPRTLEQLEDNLGALEVSLSKEDLEALDRLAPPGGMTVPYHGYDGMAWTTWGPHQYRW